MRLRAISSLIGWIQQLPFNPIDATIATRSETAGGGTAGVQSVAQTAFAGQSFGEFYSGGTPTPPTPPTPGPGGIPEPTSGLLLLVGGAMLALRRKQK